MKAPDRPSAQASHLDAIRGAAALIVVVHHVRQLFFRPLDELPSGRTLNGFLTWSAQLGGMAVAVFFVLSGFLIGSSIRSSVERRRWEWGRYVDARLSRLLVPLVPALLLTAFWDRLGMRLFGLGWPYGITFDPSSLDRGDPSAVTFLGNLFFLQRIAVPVFGTNGPLWSLSPEFWYYAIFPLGLFALRPGSASTRIALGLLALLLCGFVGREVLIHFPWWLCGAALAYLPSKEWAAGAAFRGLTLAGMVAALTAGWLWPNPSPRLIDQGLALFFALFLWSLLSGPKRAVSAGYARSSEFVAGFSYTLYLVHFPLLAFVAAWAFGNGPRWTMSTAHYLAAVGLTLACSVYAISIWAAFERNTRKIRAWLDRSFSLRVKAARP